MACLGAMGTSDQLTNQSVARHLIRKIKAPYSMRHLVNDEKDHNVVMKCSAFFVMNSVTNIMVSLS